MKTTISILFLALLTSLISSCASKVIVKKDTCVPIYDGALLECEEVKK